LHESAGIFCFKAAANLFALGVKTKKTNERSEIRILFEPPPNGISEQSKLIRIV